MKKIRLGAGSGDCSIVVGDGIPLAELAEGRRTVVVADCNVRRLHPKRFEGFDVVELEASEANKSLAGVEVLSPLVLCPQARARDALILAVGGGIVCDLAGFAAATYLRGLDFGAFATTLLAQVDASVGGKNGVNFQDYKNLIGTIRQPRFCVCDIGFLESLPARELACGFAEVIKHACIKSAGLFELLERSPAAAFGLQPELMERIVHESVAIKAAVVEEDETEQGERRKLNFGHTLGHAIELSHGLPHGEAVSIGMALEARLSVAHSGLAPAELSRLVDLRAAYRLPVEIQTRRSVIQEGISRDKKNAGSGVWMTLLRRPGIRS